MSDSDTAHREMSKFEKKQNSSEIQEFSASGAVDLTGLDLKHSIR